MRKIVKFVSVLMSIMCLMANVAYAAPRVEIKKTILSNGIEMYVEWEESEIEVSPAANVDKEVTKTTTVYFRKGGTNLGKYKIKFYGVYNSQDRYSEIYDVEVTETSVSGDIDYYTELFGETAGVYFNSGNTTGSLIAGLKVNGKWSLIRTGAIQ